jgi:hypothetical protein
LGSLAICNGSITNSGGGGAAEATRKCEFSRLLSNISSPLDFQFIAIWEEDPVIAEPEEDVLVLNA